MARYMMLVTIPHGPSDLGAEVDAYVTFDYRAAEPFRMYKRNGDPAEPPDPEQIELVEAKFYHDHSNTREEVRWLHDLVVDWLETDDGAASAREYASQQDEAGREYMADLRADR